MLPRAVAEQLNGRGHDAVSVYDIDLAGADDTDVFSRAMAEDRVVVTENFADYSLLLSHRLRTDEPCVPVVFVHKPDFPPGGALGVHLADHLHAWQLRTPTRTSDPIGRSRAGVGELRSFERDRRCSARSRWSPVAERAYSVLLKPFSANPVYASASDGTRAAHCR